MGDKNIGPSGLGVQQIQKPAITSTDRVYRVKRLPAARFNDPVQKGGAVLAFDYDIDRRLRQIFGQCGSKTSFAIFLTVKTIIADRHQDTWCRAAGQPLTQKPGCGTPGKLVVEPNIG